jgi:hypothetical protein
VVVPETLEEEAQRIIHEEFQEVRKKFQDEMDAVSLKNNYYR